MDKLPIFKFSNEELRKINHMLTKGYKFVPKDELQKKDFSQKTAKKKIINHPPIIHPPIISPNKVKIQRVKEQEYEPKIKIYVNVPPLAPEITPSQQPAGTSLKLLEKVKKYEVFNSLMNIPKTKQNEITLKQIQRKVMTLGQSYKIIDFENDLKSFCHMVYLKYAKTASQYREAAELENYLLKLINVEKMYYETNRKDLVPNFMRSMSMQSNQQRKRPQISNRAIYQPISQNKVPTPAQKRLLGQMIKKLPSQSLQQVCYIVFESTENRQYIFDLDTLHVKKFRQLQQYVKKCMQKTGQWQQRTFQDEQFSNESVFVIQDDND